ncbi:prenyltransferase [Marinobacter lipolyticus SM19]|uniref:Prenyltransferase n=1 Tax=Marinobacter lipolyticus SM19 TaxID=1318628 RepID=R8AZJ2_9GAMM|nr:prenyltransferase [Marinobacter lipolyticus]EON91758.1 prenyltransferase [Marinobacter lipolyticus SM19]
MLDAMVLRASRPNFLVLAPLCVALGIVLTWRQMAALDGVHLALVLVGALLAHAAVNLLNEYQDFRSGLDLATTRTPFSGGSGALPDRPEAAPKVLVAALMTMATMSAIGLYFLWLRGLPMLLLGVGGLVLIISYTQWITRSPWLCLLAPGLGFGPVMIWGTQVALGAQPDASSILVAVMVMLWGSELLLINQLPDVAADRQAGRRHLSIVLGLKVAAAVVAVLSLGSYLLLGAAMIVGVLPAASGLAMFTLPAALWVAWRLPHALDDNSKLSPVLGVNVATLLTTLVLLGVGLWQG